MNKKKIKIEIQRVDGQTYLSFEVDASITKMFKEQAQEIKESKSWKGLRFYFLPEITQNQSYKNLLFDFRLIDDFGASLYEGSYFNIAFLRTVGGVGKIKIKNDIPFAVVSDGMRKIVDFIKRYYEEFLKDYTVKGFVTFEV